MRLYKRTRKHGHGISIAALIDVFFLLIIFFMTVSQVTPSEKDVDLPEASQGESKVEEQKKRVVFSVASDGEMFLLGEQVGLDEIGAMLDEEVAVRGADKVEVLIRGDRLTAWKGVAQIMQLCTKKGLQRVRVGVVDKVVKSE